jgi:biopolymer transport protein ExbB/TolQ
MTDEQYKNLMKELAELKEMAWSKKTQEQLLETMQEMSEVMAKQCLVYEQQAQVFDRMEKYLSDEEDEPEKKVLLS